MHIFSTFIDWLDKSAFFSTTFYLLAASFFAREKYRMYKNLLLYWSFSGIDEISPVVTVVFRFSARKNWIFLETWDIYHAYDQYLGWVFWKIIHIIELFFIFHIIFYTKYLFYKIFFYIKYLLYKFSLLHLFRM